MDLDPQIHIHKIIQQEIYAEAELNRSGSNQQENNNRRTRYQSNETTYHPGGIYDESLNISYEEQVFNDAFSDDDVIYNSMRRVKY